MSDTKKKKGYSFYAVATGNRTGIFKNWLKCNDSVNKVSGATFKGFRTLENAERYLTKAGVQCTWVDFGQEYVDALDELESSKSRSRSPLQGIISKNIDIGNSTSDTGICTFNKSSHQAPTMTTTECTNCKYLALQVKTLTSDVAYLRRTLELLEEKYSDNTVNIEKKMSCLGEDMKVLSTEMKSMSNELKNHQVLASDVLKRNIVHQNTKISTGKKEEPMQWRREQPKYNNQNKTTSIFNWKKCIVLHNLTRPLEIEKDEIRLHLCKVFGYYDYKQISI